MTVSQLKKELETIKAYKKERVRLGGAVVEYKLLSELIEFCHPDSGVSHQACWSLEQSFLLHEESCYPFLSKIGELYEMNINSSGMRSLCKISSILSKKYYSNKPNSVKELLTTQTRESIVEGCFQQLISTEKTANMAYAVYSLYELGKEFDWIYPELKPILLQKLDENYGNGFKSSARRIIKKLGE